MEEQTRLIWMLIILIISTVGLIFVLGVGVYHYSAGVMCAELGGYYSSPFFGKPVCTGLEEFIHQNNLSCVCYPKNKVGVIGYDWTRNYNQSIN